MSMSTGRHNMTIVVELEEFHTQLNKPMVADVT